MIEYSAFLNCTRNWISWRNKIGTHFVREIVLGYVIFDKILTALLIFSKYLSELTTSKKPTRDRSTSGIYTTNTITIFTAIIALLTY